MSELKICVSMFGVENLFDGHPMGFVEAAKLADQAGMYQVNFTDHVTMGNNTDNYPYGKFPLPPEAPWFEPIVLMSAIASATTQIRFATSILIAPLRPAALLAKMGATLDVLSNGRLDLGVGIGWQREEYEAQGLDYDIAWTMLDDQIRAVKVLGCQAPANFSSRTVNFENAYNTPFPVQQGGLPIMFGVKPTERQARRIAELGAGWIPISDKASYVANGVAKIRAAFEAAGRDPAELQVRAHMPISFNEDGSGNLQKSAESIPEMLEAGATIIDVEHWPFVIDKDQLADFYAQLAEIKKQY